MAQIKQGRWVTPASQSGVSSPHSAWDGYAGRLLHAQRPGRRGRSSCKPAMTGRTYFDIVEEGAAMDRFRAIPTPMSRSTRRSFSAPSTCPRQPSGRPGRRGDDGDLAERVLLAGLPVVRVGAMSILLLEAQGEGRTERQSLAGLAGAWPGSTKAADKTTADRSGHGRDGVLGSTAGAGYQRSDRGRRGGLQFIHRRLRGLRNRAAESADRTRGRFV